MYKTSSTLLSTQTIFSPTAQLCLQESDYTVCVAACPESCFILSDILCHCYEECQFSSGYMQSEKDCITPEQCHLFCGQGYEMNSHTFS